jgi:hypothetical protein
MEDRVPGAGGKAEEKKMKDDRIRKCRKCGRPIAVISWGVYRTAIVDPEAVMVEANPEGEDFVRIDGSKVVGFEVDFISDRQAEPAYRMHRKTCGRKA